MKAHFAFGFTEREARSAFLNHETGNTRRASADAGTCHEEIDFGLAAVGVREISKKLGQARIKSAMETVLIVTKPGDSKLISLTKELAIYLITTPRYGKDYGVTVYIDKSLKNSNKFDYEELIKSSPIIKEHLKFWTPELCAARPEIFNFVLTVSKVFFFFFKHLSLIIQINLRII